MGLLEQLGDWLMPSSTGAASNVIAAALCGVTHSYWWVDGSDPEPSIADSEHSAAISSGTEDAV